MEPSTNQPLPRCEACERNKKPILDALKTRLGEKDRVLEIGSGTGQHAEHFNLELDNIYWQCTELAERLPDLDRRIRQVNDDRLPAAIALDIEKDTLPAGPWQAIYSANTFHIMAWSQVLQLIQKAGMTLAPSGQLLVYGPFNVAGQYTSDGNRQFDRHLRMQAEHMGIRNFETIRDECNRVDLQFIERVMMPANNFLLHFRKCSS